MLSDLLHDLRFSLRLLLKAPAFTLTAVLVLALGIGANSAVFSLVNGLAFKPLAGSERPGQVVGIYSRDRTRPDSYRGFSYPAFADVRDGAPVFSDVAGFAIALVGIGEHDAMRRALCGVVTARYFPALGVDVAAGRMFSVAEEHPGAGATVTIVSHEYWTAHGSDPALVGKTVRIDTRPFTVIGIAPAGFNGASVLGSPEVWVPTGAYELVVNDFMRGAGPTSIADRRSEALMVVGRLRPGTTEAAAAPSLLALSDRLERAYPAENRNQQISTHRLSRVSISTGPTDDTALVAPFVILMVMAAIVLLVACLNLANMMLARGAARRREIAMRLALGATRRHIVGQLLTEGMLLALAGGLGGLVLGYWGITLLISTLMLLAPVPLAFDMRPDVRVLAATLAFCGVSTVLFGLGPAWRLARTDLVTQMKAQSGGDGRLGRFGRFGGRNLLVAAQIALSLGLLTAAGLFTRGAIKAGAADPGYRLDGQVLVSLDTALAGYNEQQSRDLYRRVMERVRSVPGVRAASLASIVAFGNIGLSKTVQKGGTPPGAGRDGARVGTSAAYYVVGSDYFETLGVPVLRGRGFTLAEERDASAPAVAVIDEPLARALFRAGDPIGQQIQFAGRDDGTPTADDAARAGRSRQPQVMEIVGVVKGLRHDMFDKSPVPHVYVPYGRQTLSWMNVHLRLAPTGATGEAAMLDTVRRELVAVDERLPILGLKTLIEHRDASLFYWAVKAGARIFMIFSAVAVFLAVVGLYAVKAYVVARRTREIGIRIVLGSTPGQILTLVLREGLALTAAGLAVGFLVAAGIGRVVGSLLYEVSPFDPLVFAGASLVLAIAALTACYVPARRATCITPAAALRNE
jgi:predicted permease